MKLSAKIGVVQLTDHRLRLVVIKTGSATPKVLERINEALPPLSDDPELASSEQAAFIRAAIKKLKNVPTIYLLNAPHGWSVMRLLAVPFRGAKKVRAAITFELEPYLAIPIDDLIIDHNTVSEIDGKTEVFVIGIQRDPVAEQLRILAAAGVSVEGVGLDIVGLSALSLDTLLKDSAPQALVIEHEGYSYLAIVNNRSLAYVQRITASPERADAWSQEIQNAIRAFQANSLAPVTLSRVVCTYSELPDEARATLEDKLDLPIRSAVLGESWVPQSILESSDSSIWLSMIGTGSAASGGSFSISFKRPMVDKEAPTNPYKYHVAAIAALLLFALSAHLFITHIRTNDNLAEIDRLGQMVWEEFAATYPNDPLAQSRPPDDVGGSRSRDAMSLAIDAEQSSGTNVNPEMFNQPSLLNILKELSTHMPDRDVTVLEIGITKRRTKMEIRVRGETKNTGAFGKMTDGLRQSSILEIGDQKRSSIAGKETFDLVVYFKNDTSSS